jgi:c-di-GMP-binding flagellar brake protein YcgR
MIEAERRQHHRVNPHGLKAHIFLDTPDAVVDLEGEVIDISHTGVKIKLDSATAVNIDHKIRLEFLLPDSTVPFSISGILKHHQNTSELGFHYVDCPVVQALDRFMFECIKISHA